MLKILIDTISILIVHEALMPLSNFLSCEIQCPHILMASNQRIPTTLRQLQNTDR